MDSTDQYFTQAIVGPASTVFLGRRQTMPRLVDGSGLEVNLRDGRVNLSPAWGEWLLVRHLDELNGVARGRPGRARRWIERHCLLIAGAGFAAALFAIVWTIAARFLA